MTCIKTGCNIAFADSPHNVYRGDAHLFFDDTVIFKVRNPSFIPDANVDFIIAAGSGIVELTDVIVARTGNVTVNSTEIVEMWKRCYDQFILEIWSNEL
jgi:hypothetical protein